MNATWIVVVFVVGLVLGGLLATAHWRDRYDRASGVALRLSTERLRENAERLGQAWPGTVAAGLNEGVAAESITAGNDVLEEGEEEHGLIVIDVMSSQARMIADINGRTLRVVPPWVTVPREGDPYVIFRNSSE